MRLILASASERRKELLRKYITQKFEVVISNFDEKKVKFNGNCSEYVIEIAKGKVNAVSNSIIEPVYIIGCDTVVYIDGKILGKPKDKKDAFNMLKLLSGKIHKVYSGIVIKDTASCNTYTDYACTSVKFSNISDDEIYNYLEKGEYADKAGAYGIQGSAALFVEKIDGCFYNVVGLPLNKLYKGLKKVGVNL